MKKEKLFLNKERFLKEMENHKGKVHPTVVHKGHHAKLDRQSDIAAILCVSRSTLGNWLNGTNSITEDHLKELAEVFECDWEYLCGKQEYRSRMEYAISTMNKIRENFKHAKENNEPWFEYLDFEVNRTITCNNYPVDRLIREIVYFGGYDLIIEGLKGISDFIKTR